MLYGLPPAPHSRSAVVLAPVPDSLDMVEVVTFDYDAQPKEMLTACNLCGASKQSVEAQKDRYGYHVWVVTCKECGLKFLNPRMTAEAYAKFYRDGHYRDVIRNHTGKTYGIKELEKSQKYYSQRLIHFLSPFFKARQIRNLLDVGGSTGFVADAVSKHFGDLEGYVVEPSEEEAQRARERGLDVVSESIEDLAGARLASEIDLILLCQTVDHLLDISGALRTLRRLLSDDGVMFVDILVRTNPKIDHPYYLTPETMADYFRRTGFRVICSKPHPDRRHHDFLVGRA